MLAIASLTHYDKNGTGKIRKAQHLVADADAQIAALSRPRKLRVPHTTKQPVTRIFVQRRMYGPIASVTYHWQSRWFDIVGASKAPMNP